MSFSDIIGKAAQSAQRLDTEQEFWHPSQVGICSRKAVMWRAGISGEPPSPTTLRKFWMGDAIHKNIQSALEEHDTFHVFGHEVPIFSEEYKVRGSMDTLVGTPDGIEAWEYKSIHSLAFKYGSMPYPQHLWQLGAYLTFPPVDKTLPTPSRGRIIYWSKDDAEVREYITIATDESRDLVKTRFWELESLYQVYKQTGELPPTLPTSVRRMTRGPDKGLERVAHDPTCWKTKDYHCKYFYKCFGEPNVADATTDGERGLHPESEVPE